MMKDESKKHWLKYFSIELRQILEKRHKNIMYMLYVEQHVVEGISFLLIRALL
jgi:hypothetical protein